MNAANSDSPSTDASTADQPVSDKQAGAKKDATEPNFETALAELETLVEQMESGDLSLEQSLNHFEKGMQLSRHCQAALNQARQKVDVILAAEDGEPDNGESSDRSPPNPDAVRIEDWADD